ERGHIRRRPARLTNSAGVPPWEAVRRAFQSGEVPVPIALSARPLASVTACILPAMSADGAPGGQGVLVDVGLHDCQSGRCTTPTRTMNHLIFFGTARCVSLEQPSRGLASNARPHKRRTTCFSGV